MAKRGCPFLLLSKSVAVWRGPTDFMFAGGVLVAGGANAHRTLLEKASAVISAVFTLN